MYEQAIAFQTVVENDIIIIPDEYRGKLSSPVWIFALDKKRNARHKIIPRTGSGLVTENNFSAMSVHTKGWKFNREEANER